VSWVDAGINVFRTVLDGTAGKIVAGGRRGSRKTGQLSL
jgi:hypothetical protein